MTGFVDPSAVPELFQGGILVTGAGVSGLGTVALARRAGIDCLVADDDPGRRERVAAEFGVEAIDTVSAAARLEDVAVVVTSPGWRPDTPLLCDARAAGLEVIGDVELCFRLDRAEVFGPRRTWLAVTGTNGKTTTTGMLAAIMQESTQDSGLRAAACGNIGVAVSDALVDANRIDILVAELSSFQLHWSSQLVPDAGVLLNLADDHIDWHGSFAEYAAAKAKVLQAPVAVAGIDDAEVARIVAEAGRGDIIGFTIHAPGANQVGVVDGAMVSNPGDDAGETVELASAYGIEPAGAAGVLDALAAAAVAFSQGVSPRRIQDGLSGYRVQGHRGAVVHRGNGVSWVDNSKATNPHAADSALTGAGEPGTVVWVAGGQLKGASVDALVRKHGHLFRAVALLGVDREEIRRAVLRHYPDVAVFVTDSTEPDEAMDQCVRFAAAQAQPGDTVLLAPAAASLDMFSGMSARGDAFAAAAVRHC